jgi:hypothetical protein
VFFAPSLFIVVPSKQLRRMSTRSSAGPGWSAALSGTVDSNLDVFGATPRAADSEMNAAQAPPPNQGFAALHSFSDVLTVNVVSAQRHDPTDGGAEVVFYEVAAVTLSHRWSVQKRFSDFHDFHEVAVEKLRLHARSFIEVPKFPSRMHIGAQSDAFINRRRRQLEEYLHLVLSRLKAVEANHRAPTAAQVLQDEYAASEAKLAGALQHTVDFLRSGSVSSVAAGLEGADPLSVRGGLSSRPSRQRDPPVLRQASSPHPDHGLPEVDNPAARIVLRPGVSFVVLLLVPGIPMRDMYVLPNDEVGRFVIIGGRWNASVASIGASEAVDDVKADDDEATRRRSARVEPEVFYDSLPVGDFEVTFEVPPPFVLERWFTDYRDGVLSVMWTEIDPGLAA